MSIKNVMFTASWTLAGRILETGQQSLISLWGVTGKVYHRWLFENSSCSDVGVLPTPIARQLKLNCPLQGSTLLIDLLRRTAWRLIIQVLKLKKAGQGSKDAARSS